MTMPRFLAVLVESEIYVPSADQMAPDGSGLRPVLFDKEGLVTKGAEFLGKLSPELGVVLNPGQKFGFDIAPAGIRKIVEDFALGASHGR